jgi:3-keto-5-aminohexanoate cleavage enzyme
MEQKMWTKKFILNFTPTGLIPTKNMTPHVPVSPDEILRDVLDAAELGVTMVHLHARNIQTGEPAYSKDLYANIIQGIRKERPDLILGVSTSGRHFPETGKRAECLDLIGKLKPDFASLTLSSLNFNKEASINSPDTIQYLAKRMLEKGIKPELEVFDLGMINYARYLIKKDLIRPPYYFNLIMGNIACAQVDLLHMGVMIRELPENSFWSVGGVGDSQLQANLMSLVAGGGVRVGLEDNIWFDLERTKLATNHDLIKRILSIAETMNVKPYTPAEARKLFKI